MCKKIVKEYIKKVLYKKVEKVYLSKGNDF